MIATATYSPEDNKLRLYTLERLDPETYQRARAVGFRWAPRQELFVCPRWTPAAEDFALGLAGAIEDEDSTLAQRAADRAERFEGYRERREADGDREAEAVRRLADGIPLGQPILVGHHSEKRARKDAERIERGMHRAVKAWETSEYWRQRAAGAIAAAKYKERPDVRARRVKTLEAERRKRVNSYTPDPRFGVQDMEPFYCTAGGCIKLNGCGEHPKSGPIPHVGIRNGSRSVHPVPQSALPAIEKSQARWLAHLDMRLVYERAMLEAEGESGLLDPKPRPKLPPILNYRAPGGTLRARSRFHRDQLDELRQVEATKAQLRRVDSDYKGTQLAPDGSHRIRIAAAWDLRSAGATVPESEGQDRRWAYVAVFLTDSKAHPRPEGSDDGE